MKQILLDTNFILTCVRQKIDFFEEIKLEGFEILIPKQVVNEITKISKSKQKLHSKESAELALRILTKNKFKKIDIKGKYVDKAIKTFADKNPDLTIATLDRELKRKLKNPKMVIKERKRLGIV